jgi:lipoate-protein ligase A
VAHEPLVMLDLALPHGDPLASADLTESYRWLGEAVAAALATLGAATRVVSIAEARGDTAQLDSALRQVCFAGRSPYEVLVGERKLAGLAQVRRRAGALFQVGIHTSWDPWRSASLMAGSEAERATLAAGLAGRVVGLDEAAGSPLTARDLAPAVELALEQRGLRLTDDDWRADELAALEAARPRYAALAAEPA